MRKNRTREILASGGVALGLIQNGFPTPEVSKMITAAGFDWLFLDTEHGPFHTETVHAIIQACLQTPMTPIVRVADFQYDLVARTLDAGAEGIIFPRTESPEQLAKAVSWAKYPPNGVRGFGLGEPNVGYVSAGIDEIIEHHNAENIVIAQIESVAGLEAIEEIAAVEGLDCLLLGPADMSVSLGIPGQWDHPKFQDAFDRVIEACQARNIWPATHYRDPKLSIQAIERGMKLVSCNTDLALLWESIRALGATLTKARDK
jgi:2-keto-3-deoxy-L-rhamnonate aldolase RhmA